LIVDADSSASRWSFRLKVKTRHSRAASIPIARAI